MGFIQVGNPLSNREGDNGETKSAGDVLSIRDWKRFERVGGEKRNTKCLISEFKKNWERRI